MIRINNFNDLAFSCKVLAAMLETQVVIREDKEYNWAAIMFQTDNFGGIYTNLHYDYGTGNLRKNYGTDKELDIDSLSTLYKVVKEDLEHELEVRDLAYISECINAEYD